MNKILNDKCEIKRIQQNRETERKKSMHSIR